MDQPPPIGHRLAIPAIASAGAAVLHAAAAGAHAETYGLARLFVVLAVTQFVAAVIGFLRDDRLAVVTLVGVNSAAALGWAATRVVGISWIDGLAVAEQPGFADTLAATLALVAVAGAAAALTSRPITLPPGAITSAAVLVGALMLPGVADATTHDHAAHTELAGGVEHDHGDAVAVDASGTPSIVDALAPALEPAAHDHGGEDGHAANWPRPWDPAEPIDFSGVDGVSDEQRSRAEQLVAETLRDLPRFSDVSTLAALGYRSIGDESTGFEHYINTALINDDKLLDPTAPESLVYAVDGEQRTLVSAMFIAAETPIDDPSLTGYAGPLMQWHVHDNLCWGLDDSGVPVVKGVVEQFGGACPAGTVNVGGEYPMVHVWIVPHECGPFAALEGHGAGQASVSDGARMDQCGHGDHEATGDSSAAVGAAAATKPYDPDLPIDLGGVDGVTPQQQAFAENLVAATVRDLPQWADLSVVDAAGFRSIGDGASGHEHYIQWDWIDDDIILDPDHPESLVFEPQPDGSKKLVSAMFMLPSNTPIDEAPDLGGALMQWHVHGDLCFTADPEAPQVAGIKPIGTSCPRPLVDGPMAPMIHVWITPTPCGPFAALDGIAGGQVPEGEAILCDHAHGSH
jgi:hypothetical protein